MPVPDLKLIGRNVQAARKRTALSQTDLALELGVSWPTISRLERGVGKNLDLERLHQVADALGCTVHDLLRDAA